MRLLIDNGRRWVASQNGQVGLFLLYNILLYIGMLGIADVVLNFYFVSLGHPPEVIGLLQALPRLSGFLASVPLLWLIDRLGAHRVITFSTVGIFAAFALLVIAPSLPMLGFSRLLMGFFHGAQQIAVMPLMFMLVAPAARTRFFSLHNVISMGAMAFGSMIGGVLPGWIAAGFNVVAVGDLPPTQTPFAYGAALFIAGLLVLVGVLPFLLVRPQAAPAMPAISANPEPGAPDAQDPAASSTTPPAPRHPWALVTLLTLPMLTFGFTGGLTFPFYNLFFRQTFGLADETIGTILSLGWIGMAVVPLLNPWWERRMGRPWALCLTMLIAAAAFAGLGMARTLGVGLPFFFVAIAFRNVMVPMFQPLVMDHLPPSLYNASSSLSQVMWGVGWFTATAISGFLQTTVGYGVIMQIVAVGAVITGASVVLIFRRRRAYGPLPAGAPA